MTVFIGFSSDQEVFGCIDSCEGRDAYEKIRVIINRQVESLGFPSIKQIFESIDWRTPEIKADTEDGFLLVRLIKCGNVTDYKKSMMKTFMNLRNGPELAEFEGEIIPESIYQEEIDRYLNEEVGTLKAIIHNESDQINSPDIKTSYIFNLDESRLEVKNY